MSIVRSMSPAFLATVVSVVALVGTASAQDQARDQTRDQLRDPTQDQIRDQTRDRIYGSQLMTQQERLGYQERMRNAKTEQERYQLRLDHHKQMQERARQRGVTLPDEPPVKPRRGMNDVPPAMGPGMGGGMGGMGGMGGGGRGGR